MLNTIFSRLSFIAIIVLAGSAFAATPADPVTGFSERPIGTQALAVPVVDDSLQFFRDKNFGGDMTQISDITAKPAWADHSFETKAKHFSSLRWNLPRGVVVTLFAGPDCTGRSMTVWGSGEIAELSKWKMNDDLAGWSWNYVGGVAAPAKAVKDGQSDRPKYAKASEGVAKDSLQLHRDRDVKGDAIAVEMITDKPANTFKEMPKDMSSLKWNLAEGVVVTFSEKADGTGPNLAVWGNGQFDTVALWQMNDKLKFWSWQYVGAKP